MNNDAIRQFVRKELRAVTLGVATAIGIGGGLPAAIANPIGGAVVSGQGSISSPNAATTLINQQSNQLTLNWSSFNIASGQTVRFVQPSSSAVALNNILSQSPSQIFGELDANGRVVLINPNGILFGRSAQLNVGSLIASSLELKEYDPATGRLSFQSLSGHAGVIDNEGTITAARCSTTGWSWPITARSPWAPGTSRHSISTAAGSCGCRAAAMRSRTPAARPPPCKTAAGSRPMAARCC